MKKTQREQNIKSYMAMSHDLPYAREYQKNRERAGKKKHLRK
jgi:hypothetical protein